MEKSLEDETPIWLLICHRHLLSEPDTRNLKPTFLHL